MTRAIDSIVLPGTSISTSRVGFGCAQLMRLTSADERARLLDAAFDEGVRHFDVARMYGVGAAERELSGLLQRRRDQLTVATKFGIEPRATVSRLATVQNFARRMVRGVPGARAMLVRGSSLLYRRKDFSAKAAEASLNSSLRELRTEYVDILLLHEPSPDDRICEDLNNFLDVACRAGKIRAFGLSGDLEQIQAVDQTLKLNAPVMQFASDVLKSDALRVGAHDRRATILFGAINRALGPTLDAVKRERSRWTGLEERVGEDITQRKTVARLLFWHTTLRNQCGITLFSAGSPQRLRELLAPGIDYSATQQFARIARAEGIH